MGEPAEPFDGADESAAREPTPGWRKVAFALTGALWLAILVYSVLGGIAEVGAPENGFYDGGDGAFVLIFVAMSCPGIVLTILIWLVARGIGTRRRDQDGPSRTR